MSSTPPELAVTDRPLAAACFVLTATATGVNEPSTIDALVNAWTEALSIHERLGLPLTCAFGGEVIEAITWTSPDLVKQLRVLLDDGLVELLGAPYASSNAPQSAELLTAQLAEGLRTVERHFELDPACTRAAFVSGTTLWTAHALARTFTDPSLPNGGYQWVLVDNGASASEPVPSASAAGELARETAPRRIRDSSLAVAPFARQLSGWFPLQGKDDLRWWRELAFASTRLQPDAPVLTYVGDPLHTVASPEAAAAYERSLARLRDEAPLLLVGLPSWLASHAPLREADLDGEPRWAQSAPDSADPTPAGAERKHIAVRTLAMTSGESGDLARLARRRALSCDAASSAVAPIIATSGRWLASPHEQAWCAVDDIDGDGADEIVLGNDRLHVCVDIAGGARIVTLAVGTATGGALAIAPPGALVLADGKNDRWDVHALVESGPEVSVELENVDGKSPHKGTRLTLTLAAGTDRVVATYRMRRRESVIFSALSPDYAHLLDNGRGALRVHLDDKSCVATAGRVRTRLAIIDNSERTTSSVWRDLPQPAPPHSALVAIKVRNPDLVLHIEGSEIRPASPPSG